MAGEPSDESQRIRSRGSAITIHDGRARGEGRWGTKGSRVLVKYPKSVPVANSSDAALSRTEEKKKPRKGGVLVYSSGLPKGEPASVQDISL